MFLKGLRPLDDILNAPSVPDSLRVHQKTFHSMGLYIVRHVAVDYPKSTVNLYFRAAGPISQDQALKFNALAGASPPSAANFDEMRGLINPRGSTFSVTLKLSTGEIERVAYYALKLPVGVFPEIGESLKTFFAGAPSYDSEEMNAIVWSYGKGNKIYVKAERSYFGELVSLMRDWNSTFSDAEKEVAPRNWRVWSESSPNVEEAKVRRPQLYKLLSTTGICSSLLLNVFFIFSKRSVPGFLAKWTL
jgi:4-hydroxyphenylpyruvate 3-dimethylallyltransferase